MKICLNTYALNNNGLTNVQWFDIEEYDDFVNALDHIKAFQDQHLPAFKGEYEIYYADVEDDDLDLTVHYGLDYEKIVDLMQCYDDLDKINKIIVRWLYNEHSYSPERSLDEYENVTCYSYMTMKDVTITLLEDGYFGHVPEAVIGYIDVDALAGDLEQRDFQEFEDCVLTFK
jgi:hypothetical protein